jgi:hypothetical protein
VQGGKNSPAVARLLVNNYTSISGPEIFSEFLWVIREFVQFWPEMATWPRVMSGPTET